MDETTYHRSRTIDEIIAAESASHDEARRAHRGLARLHLNKLKRRAPKIARELGAWIGPDDPGWPPMRLVQP